MYQEYDVSQLTISNEEFFNITYLGNYFTGFVTKLTGVLNTKALIPHAFIGSDLMSAIQKINKRTAGDLEHFTVVTPEYVVGLIVPYLTVLKEVLIELMTIDSRLLSPLEKWAANMLTDPTYGEKAWITLPQPDKKIDTHIEKLHQYFNESVGDGTTTRTFNSVYGDSAGLKTAGTLIDELVKLSTKVLDGKLSEKATSVSKLIHRLVENKDVANNINNLPHQKMQAVVELTIQAARELELLAIVMFQTKTASYSHSETLSKINKQL